LVQAQRFGHQVRLLPRQYGGSSVLATMIVLGIAENIIRSIKKDLI
jgi:hypothetical protein